MYNSLQGIFLALSLGDLFVTALLIKLVKQQKVVECCPINEYQMKLYLLPKERSA